VRVFKRGAYVQEQYSESEWEEAKLKNKPPTKIKEVNHESQPAFQSQMEMWLSDWGTPSPAPSQTRPESDDFPTASVKKNLQPSYAPPQANKEIDWKEPKAEPAPPPRSLSQEESKRAIQEAREKRKSNHPTGGSQDPGRKSQPISSSKIMKAKVVERPPIASAAPPPMRGSHGDSIEGYAPTLSRDQIRLSPQTSLSGLSIQPFQLQSHEDTDETRIHDEQIVGEIQNMILQNQNEEKKEGEDEDEQLEEDEIEEEMDAIVKQNFFLYMWTCLEDLFGYEVISWMNDLEGHDDADEQIGHVADDDDADGEEDKAASPPQGEEEDEPQTRQVLNLPSLHRDSSIFNHLNRGINHVEKILQIHSFLLKYYNLIYNNNTRDSLNIYELYLQQKKKLFSLIRVEESFNPSFNQKQWLFLSLLLIDAILSKKIFLSENIPLTMTRPSPNAFSNTETVTTVSVVEIIHNWNNKFNAYAAGILGGGGKDAAEDILNERQIVSLRQFFTIET
jgi:hypothetical protein